MSKQINDGGTAFPRLEHVCLNDKNDSWGEIYATQGLSVRDYFAAAALTGEITAWTEPIEGNEKKIAYRCYLFADAMLAARKGGDQP
jgi:hypothetical protein